MKTLFAMFALIFVLGFVSGAQADSVSCTQNQIVQHKGESVAQLDTAAAHVSDHAWDECEAGCQWNGFCSNPSVCNHCGVIAFEIPSPNFMFEPHGRIEYSETPQRLPRLSVFYSLIDPPRA